MPTTPRLIDLKRSDASADIMSFAPEGQDKWYIHTVLAQCFLPYRDQKDQMLWERQSGDYSLTVTAGAVKNKNEKSRIIGLPFGAKPRLLMSYLQTQAIKTQSPIIPVRTSMTGMLKELGFEPQGGARGNIRSFKEQTARLAACHFRIIGPARPDGTGKGMLRKHTNAVFFDDFDVWLPTDPDQHTLWPSEIRLTDKFYENLREHAIPYDFRGLRLIQNNARAQDIYLWMTQRLYRIPHSKPLFLTTAILYEMFGGGIKSQRNFISHFKTALIAACVAYPEARVEQREGGYLFRASRPSIKSNKLFVRSVGKS